MPVTNWKDWKVWQYERTPHNFWKDPALTNRIAGLIMFAEDVGGRGYESKTKFIRNRLLSGRKQDSMFKCSYLDPSLNADGC